MSALKGDTFLSAMVQKNKMIADFERTIYTPEMLKKCWNKQVDNFTTLANAGWTNYSIVDFIHYINSRTYRTTLFPGASLGSLLISKPRNGYLNYQQTLSISYDDTSELFVLKYSDWDTINSIEESHRAVLWTVKCRGTELTQKFHEFLAWQKDWL